MTSENIGGRAVKALAPRKGNGAAILLTAAAALAVIAIYLLLHGSTPAMSAPAASAQGTAAAQNATAQNLTNAQESGFYNSACAPSPSPAAPQQYQYEGNPCHLFYINASISAINYTVNGGVDAAVAVYRNMLLVPMNQETSEANMSQTMSANYSATANPLLLNNLPFTLPSYAPPKNWSLVWGKLAAYNATTGRLVWEDNFTAPVMSQPLIANNTAYVSTGYDFVDVPNYRNGIYAINATNGNVIWNLPTVSEHMPTPVYYNNSLIIAPGDGVGIDSKYLLALNPRTGVTKWSLFIGGESAMSSPALVGNTIYFGVRLESYNSSAIQPPDAVFAVNLDTRRVVWRSVAGGNLGTQDSSPAVYGNVLVSGYGYVINQSYSSANTSHGIATLNMTYTVETQRVAVFMLGLNATTGNTLWQYYAGTGANPPRSKIPAPTVYGGIAYIDNTVTGNLVALNLTTGHAIWSFHTGLSQPNPAIVDNHVLGINQTGTLFVFEMNGTMIRKIDMQLAMGWCGSGQIAVVGNKLVFGGENNRIVIVPISSII